MVKKIMLGICGSAAAYEAIRLIRELRKNDIEVYCTLTEDAKKLITVETLEWASGNKVIEKISAEVEHIKFLGSHGLCSLFVIAPCSANTISKIASGIADTTVTLMALTALGSKKPLLIAPAMHISLYSNPIIQENLKKLEELGVILIPPRIEENKAKFPNVETIVNEILKILS